jgi:hypothetical protein
MDQYEMARLAVEVAEQLDIMKDVPDEHLALYLEDVRARLYAADLSLEDVVTSGIHRAGRVTKQIAKQAMRRRPDSHLTTLNWQQEIQRTLLFHTPYMAWRDRTCLRKMLLRPYLNTFEMIQAENIVNNAFYASIDDEDGAEAPAEIEAPAPGHDRPTQLGLKL